MQHIVTLLATAEHATKEPQGIAALGIDPLAILAQGATFLILFFIIKKFAFKKIVKVLEDRRKTIEGSLTQAESLNKQNKEAEKRVNELLKEARYQAEDIINKGHEEAGAVIAQAETEAVAKAEKIIADGQLKMKAEVVKAREVLKKETLDLVVAATTALLGKAVDKKAHETLIKDALKEKSV